MTAIVSGPHGKELQWYTVIDREGAEVARVFIILHGCDVTHERARGMAINRASYLAERVTAEPTP